MNDVTITSTVNDDEATFTTGESLFSFRSKTGTLTIEPGWYRVDQQITITGTMSMESGSIVQTCAARPSREPPSEPRQEPSQALVALPPDSRPPRLVRLLSWLRRPPGGRGGPPSGEPVAGL